VLNVRYVNGRADRLEAQDGRAWRASKVLTTRLRISLPLGGRCLPWYAVRYWLVSSALHARECIGGLPPGHDSGEILEQGHSRWLSNRMILEFRLRAECAGGKVDATHNVTSEDSVVGLASAFHMRVGCTPGEDDISSGGKKSPSIVRRWDE
jgi:hypothetical protein